VDRAAAANLIAARYGRVEVQQIEHLLYGNLGTHGLKINALRGIVDGTFLLG